MKRSWKDKLDRYGLNFVEAHARLRRITPLTGFNMNEVCRWLKEQKAVLASYPTLDKKRKVKLDPKFIRLYLQAHPEIELNAKELKALFEREEFPTFRADELELAQRIALALEGAQNQRKRMEAYEGIASALLLLQHLFSGGLKKQFGKRTPEPVEFLLAIAQNLEWAAGTLRGNVTQPPGRVNTELASLVDTIVEHQVEPLTQIELYQALEAAGAKLPEDPEAFRLWLHRARKQGLVKGTRTTEQHR